MKFTISARGKPNDRAILPFLAKSFPAIPIIQIDGDFLARVPEKDRITLFANAGCALICPSRICYVSVSKINKGEGGEFKCSQPLKQRDLRGMVDFDLTRLQDLGFSRFKLLRARPG